MSTNRTSASTLESPPQSVSSSIDAAGGYVVCPEELSWTRHLTGAARSRRGGRWTKRSSTKPMSRVSRRTALMFRQELRGTYAGLAHPSVIRYLDALGVTAIELMPVHQFVHEG